MAQLHPRNQATGVPQSGRHDSKPEGGRLTANAVTGLKPRRTRYDITDPGSAGVQLRVMPSGAKRWYFRFYWRNKRQRLGLGLWPAVGLAEARARAQKCREVLDEGIDPRKAGIVKRGSARIESPVEHAPAPASPAVWNEPAIGTAARAVPRAVKRPTDLSDDPNDIPMDTHSVRFLAHEFYHRHVVKERRRKRPAYVKRVLNADLLPTWNDRDARTITSREVVELLDKIVDRGSPVMANRTANILNQMFMYGIHRAIVAGSPVKLLYRPGGTEAPAERALSETELKAFLLNCKSICRTRRSGHILMTLLLTMQRRQELALATKKEFDLENRTWSIPDEHAKKGRGHVLPLSDWAVNEIRSLMGISGASAYLLPRKNRLEPINPMLITRSVERLAPRFQAAGIEPFTPHDLRRTGRTGLASLGIEDEVAERVLNHQKKGMKRVYDRFAYSPQKRDAIEKWAKYLSDLLAQAQREKAPAAAIADVSHVGMSQKKPVHL
jgi:integrase